MPVLTFDQLEAAAAYLKPLLSDQPQLAVITGTGLGQAVVFDHPPVEIPYARIPHMPQGRVESHSGTLLSGYVQQVPVVVFAGRIHYYEGADMSDVVFSTRLAKWLGCRGIILTNVSGSVQPHYMAGDLVVISDHINLMPSHPLRGANDPRLGARFPDMARAYHPIWRNLAYKTGIELGLRIHNGIYLALQGPSLETPAEYRMIRLLGADIVGMSTVPEAIAAHHVGLQVLGISMVSNCAWPYDSLAETTLDEVIEAAHRALPRLQSLVSALIPQLVAHFDV